MATLSEVIISWWILIASQLAFDFIAPNIMAKVKGKEYQGIWAIEAFE